MAWACAAASAQRRLDFSADDSPDSSSAGAKSLHRVLELEALAGAWSAKSTWRSFPVMMWSKKVFVFAKDVPGNLTGYTNIGGVHKRSETALIVDS